MIAAQNDIEPKVTWMFQLIDEDKSHSLKKEEVKKFLSLLLETSNFINEEEVNFEEFFQKIYPIIDEKDVGLVSIEDFIRATKNSKEIYSLITSYTSIISYKIELEKHKESIESVNSLDQVAGFYIYNL
jgi:hypothetical protein